MLNIYNMDLSQQSQMDHLNKLNKALEEQICIRKQEQTSLIGTIDALRIERDLLRKENESLKLNMVVPLPTSPQAGTGGQAEFHQLRLYQIEVERLKQQNQCLEAEKSVRQSKIQMEKTLLHRQMEVLKKLAVQNDNSVKKVEIQDSIIKVKDDMIQQLEDSNAKKQEQIDSLKDQMEELKLKLEIFELDKVKFSDVQSQLLKYQKDILQHKKAYDQLKNSTSVRIDMLEHKLTVVNNELQRNLDEKSQNFVEREQLGRTISQLRQVNQMLTLQVQTVSKQNQDLLKNSPHNDSQTLSSSKLEKEIDTMRTEMSRLIAINFTLSKELNNSRGGPRESARQSIKSGRINQMASSKVQSDRRQSMRQESPIYERSHRIIVDQQENNRSSKGMYAEEKSMQIELRRMRHQMLAIKSQNNRVHRQNAELTNMNQFLVKKNATLEIRESIIKPLSPTTLFEPRYEENYIVERRTTKNSSFRPQEKLAQVTMENEQSRSSRQVSNKAKLLALQKKLLDVKFEQTPKISPTNRNVA